MIKHVVRGLLVLQLVNTCLIGMMMTASSHLNSCFGLKCHLEYYSTNVHANLIYIIQNFNCLNYSYSSSTNCSAVSIHRCPFILSIILPSIILQRLHTTHFTLRPHLYIHTTFTLHSPIGSSPTPSILSAISISL